jgi:hypothetical protein
MKLFRLIPALLFLSFPFSLHAQLGLYGSFTTAKLNVTDHNNWIYGGTFGAYLASGRLAVLSAGVDLRASFLSSSSTKFNSGSIGPRVSLNLHVLPIHPYVEATAGVGSATFEPSSSTTKFEYQLLGGADYTILPRIDWRVAEFSYGGLSGLNGSSFHPKSISTGLVLRIPNVLLFR